MNRNENKEKDQSVSKFLKSNIYIILALFLVVLVNLFLYSNLVQDKKFKEDLIESELQRKAVMTTIAMKSGMEDKDGLIHSTDLSAKLQGVTKELQEVDNTLVAIDNQGFVEITASSNKNEIGLRMSDLDYKNALFERKIVSFKEFSVVRDGSSERKNRVAVVIVPISYLNDATGEKINGIISMKILLNDIDYLSGILLGNIQFLTIFEIVIITIIILSTLFVTNSNMKKLEKAREEIFVKDQILATTAHELGNPVSFIKGAVTTVIKNEPNLDPKSKKLLDRTLITSNFLTTFIEDILVVSRLERGKIKIYSRPIHIDETLEKVYLDNKDAAATKGLKLKYVKPTERIPKIIADPTKIQEVAGNLVSNAIKYSEKGEIVMNVKLEQNEIIVSVSDNGQGIKPEDMDKLFKKFGRLSNTSQHIKGTGLGLYISKRLINLHKGRIWVESEYGKGSTFYFSLPLNYNE
ncbi:HAMP domain-containing histidine kinase [Candidatus Dojkabacteria bacterium]|uniref:histidine kinase n=1 Tax=Candidatus Dojkabacteria bacterium TaxID=2099670 RepID=A0A955RI97_9BACT|nr:HAMP domain-containing histidine kinase [Candidatus Dojkabacteria bacterium]